MKPLVAVTSYYNRDLIEPALIPLRKKAIVRYGPDVGRNLQETELIQTLAGADAVIAADERYNSTIFDAAPKLQIISRDGAGFNGIEIAEATQRGVAVTNAPVMHEATATMTLGLIIATVRKLIICDRAVRNGHWTNRSPFLNPGLDGLKLGLIGFGMIGRGVARRAASCGMDVLAYSRSLEPEEATRLGATVATFEKVLTESDVLSLHVPLTKTTRGLIGAPELSAMKQGAYLINTCRGPVIDEVALINALNSGHLAGAGLDVFRNEPPEPENPLLFMNQVVLTPHMGGDTARTMLRAIEVARDNILSYFDGNMPRNLLNPTS